MTHVLVDTSVWVDYFKGGDKSAKLNVLIDQNIVAINDVILAELLPYMLVNKHIEVVKLLNELVKLPLSVDWDDVIRYRTQSFTLQRCHVGIADLLIALNAKKNACPVYSIDEGFQHLVQIMNVELYPEKKKGAQLRP